MSDVEIQLVTESHPLTTSQRWVLTESARQQLVAQLPGKPVDLDFDPARRVGEVVDAREDDVDVFVTVSVTDDDLVGRLAGPLFSPLVDITDSDGTLVVMELKAIRVGLIKQ